MTSMGSTPPVSFTGIMSGLNTQQIISAYLQVAEQPLVDLQNQQSTINSQVSDYQTIQSQLQALQTAANALTSGAAFTGSVAASSSNTQVASATVGNGASTGSVTFSVNQLATTDSMMSSGTVASTGDVVTSGDLLLASGGSGIGISSMSGSGLTVGQHTISVTQASAGASVTSASPLPSSTTISSSNNQLAVTIDGTAYTFTIASGTYTSQQLASAVASSSGGLLNASVNSSGQLVLSTAEQGSAATLQVGSGSANTALGLSTMSSAVSGVNGIINVDGTSNTITDISATSPTSVTLTSGTGGTVSATLSTSGLSVGSITAQNISTGNGSLASVVSAINSAGIGVSAQALQVGTNAYALSLTSNSSGAANDISVSPTAFSSSGLGTLQTVTAGQNAIISLGGTGGYTVESASNNVTTLLAGVTISLNQTSSSPVTISVSPNATQVSKQVQSFVNAANTVLQTISTDTAYNQQTNTAGPLNGDVQLQNLSQQILAMVGQAIGSSSVPDTSTVGSAAGLSIDGKTQQINFNAATFATDFQNNPTGVAAMFTEGGTFSPTYSGATPSDVSLVYASNSTQAGSYNVTVSQSASQATDNGSVTFSSPTSAVSSSDNYTITSGSQSVTYGVSSGETLSEIANGLNTAFAQGNMALSAQVVSSGSSYVLQVTSNNYGSSNTFSVTSSSTDVLGIVGSSFTGTNVAGTINGVAATGSGQILTAPSSDPSLAGLSLQVTTPGITSSTSLGTFNYTPGLSGSLANLVETTLNTTNGEIPSKIQSLQNSSTQIGSQITLQKKLIVQEQQQLTSEFTAMETTLAQLKSEQSYLSSLSGSSSSIGSLTGATSSTTGG
ncbi:MAG: flagellar filament capping protein FliD [Firmicutes bacterium]|nr:flagellar filament capping protein FliD [Bacillota bacterium]